jgi:NADPH2:quinone reductase
MRAMRARGFKGYGDLELVNLAKPEVSDGKVLVRMTAAGVTPLDHTILSGQYYKAKAPLVLGNEGAGVVAEGGGTEFPAGSRVMFTGLYGVSEDGTYSEYLAVRKQHLCLIPENIDNVSAAGVQVAYLTAQMALSLAGFQAGKTVLSPAIGGSVGNAATQLARALGAKHAVSSTTNHKKAEQAKTLGFDEVIDLSGETLSGGVRRITDGYGADIVIDAIGGETLSEALSTLAAGGTYTTLGYSAGRKATIDVTDLETGHDEKLCVVGSAADGLGGSMAHYRPLVAVRWSQANRGQDLPAGRGVRRSALSYRRPSIRQGRPDHGRGKLNVSFRLLAAAGTSAA